VVVLSQFWALIAAVERREFRKSEVLSQSWSLLQRLSGASPEKAKRKGGLFKQPPSKSGAFCANLVEGPNATKTQHTIRQKASSTSEAEKQGVSLSKATRCSNFFKTAPNFLEVEQCSQLLPRAFQTR